MGRRGPTPRPTQLHVIQGDPSKIGKNKLKERLAREPKPTQPITSQPPDYLPERAKEEWLRLVPELRRMKLLTGVDRDAFIGYCLAWDDLMEATAYIEEHGMSYVDEHGNHKPYPQLRAKYMALEKIKVFSVEFGLTPAARSRMVTPDPGPAKPSEFEGALDA